MGEVAQAHWAVRNGVCAMARAVAAQRGSRTSLALIIPVQGAGALSSDVPAAGRGGPVARFRASGAGSFDL